MARSGRVSSRGGGRRGGGGARPRVSRSAAWRPGRWAALVAALALAGAAGYAILTGVGSGSGGSGRLDGAAGDDAPASRGRGGAAPHADLRADSHADPHAEIDEASRRRLRGILRDAERAERED